jgi:Homing endonuclease associated repeat
MAPTIRAAFAAVEGSALDATLGLTIRPQAGTPVEPAIATAFAGIDSSFYARLGRKLAARDRCHPEDAEEALQDTLLDLLVRKRELFRRDPRNWVGLLYVNAHYRLLAIKGRRSPLASIEVLDETAGDRWLVSAAPCLPETPARAPNCRHLLPPRRGETWSPAQIVGSFQRFSDYHGRPPKSQDCMTRNGLPSGQTIRRHFASFGEALHAAGFVPASAGRRAPWSPRTAAEACLAFKRRHGHWPGGSDAERHPGQLPNRGAMRRCLGGTRPSEVQRGTELILGLEAGW